MDGHEPQYNYSNSKGQWSQITINKYNNKKNLKNICKISAKHHKAKHNKMRYACVSKLYFRDKCEKRGAGINIYQYWQETYWFI